MSETSHDPSGSIDNAPNMTPGQGAREFIYGGRVLFYLLPLPEEGSAPQDERVTYFMSDEVGLRQAIDTYAATRQADVSQMSSLSVFNEVIRPALLEQLKIDNAAELSGGRALPIRTKTISVGEDLSYTFKPVEHAFSFQDWGETRLPSLATLLRQGDSRPNTTLNVTWVTGESEHMNKHTGERLGFGTYDLAHDGALHPEAGDPALFNNAFVALMSYDPNAVEPTGERYAVKFREGVDRNSALNHVYVLPRVNFYNS